MSLDECMEDVKRSAAESSEPKREPFYPSHHNWIFRFRGKAPGRFGGSIVAVRLGPGSGVLSVGVSICTPTDPWNPKRGIEIADARMNCPGSTKRPNKWRFTKAYGMGHLFSQREVYELARQCLHHVFILHQFSKETLNWFERQLPWVITGKGLKPNGKIQVG